MGTRALCLALLVLCLLPLAGIARASESAYLEELIRRAATLRLAETPEWRALLHYRRPPWGGGVRSLADDPDFFLAEAGKTDPEAELEGTLRAFFATEPTDEKTQHPQCAFIARYHYLKRRLDFDPARLRERDCERYETWRALIQPGGITLVFAEAFMNNPASMFGHTLLRIDTAEDRGKRDLLGWAVNFAGATGDEGGPVYAFKGIFGLYSGYFSIAPYYEKVKEYGDWENRDIWEYQLNLSIDEIDEMLRHLWEVQGIAFNYYYFDENCSYQLLALLETARPGRRLTDGFPLWVIPSDTVRTIVLQAGLLESVTYRPAGATELRHAAAALAPVHRRLARLVGTGTVDPEDPLVSELPPEQGAAVLSVAYSYLRHRYLTGEVEREDSAALSRRILIARSRVAVRGSPTPPPVRPQVRPDQGHGSARFALEAGWRENLAYVEARIRPALHELIDPEGGYTAGAEIQFLDLAVRIFPEQNRVRLQEAVVLDIVSLVPWDSLFRPISWRFGRGSFPTTAADRISTVSRSGALAVAWGCPRSWVTSRWSMASARRLATSAERSTTTTRSGRVAAWVSISVVSASAGGRTSSPK